MLAARLYGPRDLRVEEIPAPKPERGWALVRTLAVGICGTDKAFYRGTYRLFKTPLVPGHEAVGVAEGGELDGRVVVSEINFACGRCEMCRAGLYTHCPYKRTLGIDFDGGMAEYFVAPLEALHPAEGLDPAAATQVEPLAAVLNALAQVPPPPGAKVAILGTGNVAYLAAQVLRGFDPVVVARRGSAKAHLFRGLGLEVVELGELGEYMAENAPLGFDVVFEATGDPSAINTAIEIARPRGVIHLKSTPGSPAPANLTPAVVKELRIVGTRCGTYREFRHAIKLIREGIVKPLITSVVTGIHNAREAFERALQPNEVKVVLKP
ncbi:Alcohol dehydrogenase GroES domain protein [Pyrobaculum islandicum DSM 4184]|uniref:Alcohol dehydrogenase GroES domain protein n=1 Tax=Pyrobaculum islandicum (strain DSM 4184 / JCM 9189 / GEO3) TaxID=384616 RepID=A1RVW4_PYRIL|nr:alcohol dehydrogenase catalytic domain-containing protein [Pyrobaculum islandicum]ABL89096.1 Alcohol dehydrogenase GroES domain protein [Pyrobaculum islandicum DSM 4184]